MRFEPLNKTHTQINLYIYFYVQYVQVSRMVSVDVCEGVAKLYRTELAMGALILIHAFTDKVLRAISYNLILSLKHGK